jgi:hypothetical protein
MTTVVSYTAEDMTAAAEHLVKSTKGRHALQALLRWLNDDGLGLDLTNQEAVLTLLDGAWGPFAGTARDAMHDALSNHGQRK